MADHSGSSSISSKSGVTSTGASSTGVALQVSVLVICPSGVGITSP